MIVVFVSTGQSSTAVDYYCKDTGPKYCRILMVPEVNTPPFFQEEAFVFYCIKPQATDCQVSGEV